MDVPVEIGDDERPRRPVEPVVHRLDPRVRITERELIDQMRLAELREGHVLERRPRPLKQLRLQRLRQMRHRRSVLLDVEPVAYRGAGNRTQLAALSPPS